MDALFAGNQLGRRGFLRGAALIGAYSAFPAIPAWAAAPAKGSAKWPSVFAEVDSYVKSGKVANMVAMLGYGTGGADIISAGNLMMRSGPKAGADSLYRIYSMTKPITGMAAMILVDEGKIGLDQNIADFIPGFAQMMVQKQYDGAITPDNLEAAKVPITVRMLMTHTSGLGYNIIQKGPLMKAMLERGLMPGKVSRLPVPGFTPGKTVSSLETYANEMAKLPLVFQPGTKWLYSAGLDILGRVIEVATGMSFDKFLQERIFDPCGMTSTYFTVPEDQKHRLTTNYMMMNGIAIAADPGHSSIFLDKDPVPFGGAGLVSSPRDYDRFLQMLVGRGVYKGKRVMNAAAVEKGTSNLLPEGASTKGSWVDGQGFGAGGRVTGTGFGWAGAAGTSGFCDMKSGLRAGNYTQYMPSDTYPIGSGFAAIVLKDVAAQASKAKPKAKK